MAFDLRAAKLISLLAALLALAAPPALAAQHVLFIEPGESVLDYNELVAKLQAGDQVIFSNGKEFTIEKVLGHGNTTQVLALTDGRALRIPLKAGLLDNTEIEVDWINEFLRASERLSLAGVAAVKVFTAESLDREYAVVERLEIKFTLEEFLEGKLLLDRKIAKPIWEKLTEFARTTWKFSKIGDFASRQIGWTGERWVLFDFSNVFHSYQHAPTATVFDSLEIGSYRAQMIVFAIKNERAKNDPEYCSTLLRKR